MAYDINAILQGINNRKTATSSPVARQTDVARLILQNSTFKAPASQDATYDKDTSGPSVISRIFDILSRPNYAVAEYLDRAINEDKTPLGPEADVGDHIMDTLGQLTSGHSLSGLWEGFSGREKTTFSDVIQNSVGADQEINPIAKYGGGFALDVLLDPTTYIGAGLVKSGAKALGIGKKTSRADEIVAPKSIGAAEDFDLNLIRNRDTLPDPAAHFNLQTSKPLPAEDLVGLKLAGLDISPNAGRSKLKLSTEAQSAFDNLPKGLAGKQRLNRPQIIKNMVDEILAQSPRRKPEAVKKEVQQLVTKMLPKTEDTRFRKIAEEFENIRGAKTDPDFSTFKIEPRDPTTSPVAGITHITTKAQEVFDQLPIGTSEKLKAEEIAQKYIVTTLSKPNKFAKSGTTPIVNNPAQQTNLWLKFKSLERQTGGKLSALKMMREAEGYLIAQGFNPKYWDGSETRLTDIIGAVSRDADSPGEFASASADRIVDLFRKGANAEVTDDISRVVKGLVESSRADSAIKEAGFVDAGIEQAINIAQKGDGIFSEPKFLEFKKEIASQNKKTLEAREVSPAALQTAEKLAQDLLGTGPKGTTGANKASLYGYLDKDGKEIWVTAQQAQSKQIAEQLGINFRKASKQIGEGNRAADTFMSRMATWWGQKDIRPMVLSHTMTAQNSASARARIYNDLSKKYDKDTLEEGFKVAQSRHSLDAATPQIAEAAQIFQKAMDNLFGSTGLTNEAMAETVAGRSGVVMRDLNKQLKAYGIDFEFKAARIMDDQGVVHDYSNGTDWLKSWETYPVKDPVEFLFKIESAVEQLTHKYAFMDEIAARWGSPHPVGEFNTKISLDDPIDYSTRGLKEGYQRVDKKGEPVKARPREKKHRLDGYYFPRDIASQIENGLKNWEQIYNPKSDLIRLYDKVLRSWKSGVTIYAPSHHIRNMIGDVYLSWMAGVNSMTPYNKAAKVIWSQAPRYRDLDGVENLVGRNAVANALTKPGDAIVTTKSGQKLTAEQIYVAAHNQGLLIYTHAIEDIFGGELFTKFKPFGGKVQGAARKLSENREHYARLAHFIDILSKSKEKDLQKLFFNAGREVRKWHPDGTDLTDFERTSMRRLFPFYSWTRKSIPLLVETAVMNPAKTNLYPKGMQALQGMMGVEAPSRTDPFPTDQLFPDWIKEKGIGPIAAHGMAGIPGLVSGLSRSIPGFSGDPKGYTVVNPSNPFMDMVAQFGGMGNANDPLKGVGEMLTPAFRLPAEIIAGRTFTGAPIDYNEYVAENIPIVAMLSRLTNVGITGQPTRQGEKEGFGNSEALMNLLFALGIRGTGPYIKQAEFEERDRAAARRAERKEAAGG